MFTLRHGKASALLIGIFVAWIPLYLVTRVGLCETGGLFQNLRFSTLAYYFYHCLAQWLRRASLADHFAYPQFCGQG